MPEEVDPRDEHFDPRRGPIYVRAEAAEPKRKVLSWLPTRGINRRLDYVARVLKAAASSGRSPRCAQWMLAVPGKPPGRLAATTHDGRLGVVRQVDHTWLRLVPGRPGRRDVPLPAMPPPGLGVGPGVCTTMGCAGALDKYSVPAAEEDDDHYRHLYRSLNPVPLSASEHTGQLTSRRGGGHPAALHPRRGQRPVLLHHVRAGRGRRRAAVRRAAEHAADHRQLRAARRPGRTPHRIGSARRDLRAAPVARPVPVPGPESHGRR